MVTCNLNGGMARRSRASAVAVCAVLISLYGCASPWLARKKEAAEISQEKKDNVKDLWQSPDRPRTIDQLSRKVITIMRAENVALVTELPGTGGKVEASAQRDRMLDFMRRKNVPNPNQWLDDPSTAMVAAEVIVPPAGRKGDRLNVLVDLSKHSEGTNLQGGWLMRTELVEMMVIGPQVREGFGFAMAEGPLVTKKQISGEESLEAATRAMVVGGAVLMQSRTIGLAIAEEFAHAITMAQVIPAINRRFTVFDGSNQIGVAKPQQENYIELTVPPRYRRDPDHFANVVMHLGVAEPADERKARIECCRLELMEPTTARRAAWQLEAVGKETIPILLEGLQNPDKEVRFYSAHALAYLNDARSIPVLQELAASEPAFRAMCFNGLTLVESYKAGDALEELLHVPDAETRYGALLALREHDSHLRLVQGEMAGKVGSILELPSTGPNQVVVGLTLTPEIVIFGPNPAVQIQAFSYVNPRLMLRTTTGGRISVSHIVPGRDDRIVECSADLKSVLGAMAEVGCNYGDWVNFVRLCGVEKHIAAEVAMNPVPTSGRKFNRDGTQHESGDEATEVNDVPAAVPASDAKAAADREQSGWYNPLRWFANNE